MSSVAYTRRVQQLYAHFQRSNRKGGSRLPSGVASIALVDDDDVMTWHVQLVYTTSLARSSSSHNTRRDDERSNNNNDDEMVVALRVCFASGSDSYHVNKHGVAEARMPLVFVISPRLVAPFIHHGALCALELLSQRWPVTYDGVVVLLLSLHATLQPFVRDARATLALRRHDDAGERGVDAAATSLLLWRRREQQQQHSSRDVYTSADHAYGLAHLRRVHPHLFRDYTHRTTATTTATMSPRRDDNGDSTGHATATTPQQQSQQQRRCWRVLRREQDVCMALHDAVADAASATRAPRRVYMRLDTCAASQPVHIDDEDDDTRRRCVHLHVPTSVHDNSCRCSCTPSSPQQQRSAYGSDVSDEDDDSSDDDDDDDDDMSNVVLAVQLTATPRTAAAQQLCLLPSALPTQQQQSQQHAHDDDDGVCVVPAGLSLSLRDVHVCGDVCVRGRLLLRNCTLTGRLRAEAHAVVRLRRCRVVVDVDDVRRRSASSLLASWPCCWCRRHVACDGGAADATNDDDDKDASRTNTTTNTTTTTTTTTMTGDGVAVLDDAQLELLDGSRVVVARAAAATAAARTLHDRTSPTLRAVVCVSNAGKLRVVDGVIDATTTTTMAATNKHDSDDDSDASSVLSCVEAAVLAEQDASLDMARTRVVAGQRVGVSVQSCTVQLSHCHIHAATHTPTTATTMTIRTNNKENDDDDTTRDEQDEARARAAAAAARVSTPSRTTGIHVELAGALTALHCLVEGVYFAMSVLAHSRADVCECHARDVVNAYTIAASTATLRNCSACARRVGVFALQSAKCVVYNDDGDDGDDTSSRAAQGVCCDDAPCARRDVRAAQLLRGMHTRNERNDNDDSVSDDADDNVSETTRIRQRRGGGCVICGGVYNVEALSSAHVRLSALSLGNASAAAVSVVGADTTVRLDGCVMWWQARSALLSTTTATTTTTAATALSALQSGADVYASLRCGVRARGVAALHMHACVVADADVAVALTHCATANNHNNNNNNNSTTTTTRAVVLERCVVWRGSYGVVLDASTCVLRACRLHDIGRVALRVFRHSRVDVVGALCRDTCLAAPRAAATTTTTTTMTAAHTRHAGKNGGDDDGDDSDSDTSDGCSCCHQHGNDGNDTNDAHDTSTAAAAATAITSSSRALLDGLVYGIECRGSVVCCRGVCVRARRDCAVNAYGSSAVRLDHCHITCHDDDNDKNDKNDNKTSSNAGNATTTTTTTTTMTTTTTTTTGVRVWSGSRARLHATRVSAADYGIVAVGPRARVYACRCRVHETTANAVTIDGATASLTRCHVYNNSNNNNNDNNNSCSNSVALLVASSGRCTVRQCTLAARDFGVEVRGGATVCVRGRTRVDGVAKVGVYVYDDSHLEVDAQSVLCIGTANTRTRSTSARGAVASTCSDALPSRLRASDNDDDDNNAVLAVAPVCGDVVVAAATPLHDVCTSTTASSTMMTTTTTLTLPLCLLVEAATAIVHNGVLCLHDNDDDDGDSRRSDRSARHAIVACLTNAHVALHACTLHVVRRAVADADDVQATAAAAKTALCVHASAHVALHRCRVVVTAATRHVAAALDMTYVAKLTTTRNACASNGGTVCSCALVDNNDDDDAQQRRRRRRRRADVVSYRRCCATASVALSLLALALYCRRARA